MFVSIWISGSHIAQSTLAIQFSWHHFIEPIWCKNNKHSWYSTPLYVSKCADISTNTIMWFSLIWLSISWFSLFWLSIGDSMWKVQDKHNLFIFRFLTSKVKSISYFGNKNTILDIFWWILTFFLFLNKYKILWKLHKRDFKNYV